MTGTGSADSDLIRSAAAARRRTRKHVDRRASKGRKIRYTVIPKLVNFMAPQVKHEYDLFLFVLLGLLLIFLLLVVAGHYQ
jgi:protein AATF/BFR2